LCTQCKKVFNKTSNLERHQQKHNSDHSHHCPDCLKAFMNEDALTRHMQEQHVQVGGAMKRPLGGQNDNRGIKRQKLQETDDAKEFYTIDKVSEEKIEKFKSTASYYKITVSRPRGERPANYIEVTEDLVSINR